MVVALRHPVTGRVKTLQGGWSWSCFFGSSFFGVPLFMRGLPGWGAAMALFSTVVLTLNFAPGRGFGGLGDILSLAGLALSLFFGLRANAMAIDRYLNNGWVMIGRDRGPFAAGE